MPLLTMTSGIVNTRAKKGFKVEGGKGRFNLPIKYRGINPNYVKLSAKDTEGQLSVFEYEGF